MAYSPIVVANEFITRHGEAGSIDPMKLQKLLYFANGWYLGLAGEPLLTERPQVWRYGPVFRWVYATFARFGRSPIREPVSGNPFRGGEPELLDAAGREDIGRLIDWIWDEYGGQTGIQLSDATHAPGTPWRRIAEANGFRVKSGTEIPPADDYAFFSKLVADRGWTPAPLTC